MHGDTSNPAEHSAAHECAFEMTLWDEEMARLEERLRQWDDSLVPAQPTGSRLWKRLRQR